MALGFIGLAAALAPYGMHVAHASSSPLRLRGGVSMRVLRVAAWKVASGDARASFAWSLLVAAD